MIEVENLYNRKPNFFIVGAPKAGTTSLYHYLEEHPEIFMSAVKETNFFSYGEIKEQHLFYGEEHIISEEQYYKLFQHAGAAKAIGEASVSYLFYPSVPLKIKQFNPGAKIIIVLRNPVDRGFSHYLMDQRLGFVNISFEDILNHKVVHRNSKLFYQQYIELGLYHEQVKRYLDTFDTNAVKIFLYEDLVTDINRVVKEIYSFLEVDELFLAGTDKLYNSFSYPKNKLAEKLYAASAIRKFAKRIAGGKAEAIKRLFMANEKKPKLPDTLRAELVKLYTPDLLKTQDLINRDLSSWMII